MHSVFENFNNENVVWKSFNLNHKHDPDEGNKLELKIISINLNVKPWKICLNALLSYYMHMYGKVIQI